MSRLSLLIRIKYPRLLFDDCWHHVAVVLEVGWEAGAVPMTVYVDGVDVSSLGEANRLPAEAADDTLAVHSSTQVRQSHANTIRLFEIQPLCCATQVFGTPFRVGSPGASPGKPALDEVVLWSRALSEAEVVERAHPVPRGAPACEAPSTPPPPPPPIERCTVAQAETTPAISMSVRFLSASLLVVISDPTGIAHNRSNHLSFLQIVQLRHLTVGAAGR